MTKKRLEAMVFQPRLSNQKIKLNQTDCDKRRYLDSRLYRMHRQKQIRIQEQKYF